MRPDPDAILHPRWPIVADSRSIPLRDTCTPLIVTSPAYNVSISYPTYQDHVPWPIYRQRARRWSLEMARILIPGGRVFLNVQPVVPDGRDGYPRVDLAGIWHQALANAGLTYRDTIVWIQDSFDGGCQWGSWCKPSAPNLRGSHEAILVFYKPTGRPGDGWKREPRPVFRGWTAPRDELGGDWVDLARNVWTIQPAKTNKKAPDYYPATYPIEIPARAIRLSTWPNELVVDPFSGSGTTGLAAEKLGRRSVMLDLQ